MLRPLYFFSLVGIAVALVSVYVILHYDFAIVYGDSMFPAYQQGDIAIITKDDKFDSLKDGDVIMYHTYAFDPTWAPNVNVMHRVISSYVYPDTGEKVLITKGDNNQDTHALIDYPICEQYYEGKVVAKIPYVALPRVLWGQSYEQLLDDEELPHWNQQQVIAERTAGCMYAEEYNLKPIDR
jgi:signal peptidase I